MADLSVAVGVNATIRAAIVAGTSGVGAFLDGANEHGTKLRAMYDTYVVPTADTLHTDCVLTMSTLPVGARCLGWIYAQSGAGEACVATAYIGAAAASKADAFIDMTNAYGMFVGALTTFSATPLTTEGVVSLHLGTADIDGDAVLTLVTIYILED